MPSYLETRQVITWKNSKGKDDVAVVEEGDVENYVKGIEEEGGTDLDLGPSQSFTFHKVSETDPLTDFRNLVTSVSVQADVINRSIVLKQQQYVRRLMIGTKSSPFSPVEGAYDLQSVIGAEAERKTASVEEKAANNLSKILGRSVTMEELNSIIEAMKTPGEAATA
jgi:hypothetical protein